jgi:hypothetical protein
MQTGAGAMRLLERYEPGPITSLGIRSVEGWRLKLYGIA